MSGVDPKQLPIDSPVRELKQEAGRTRVTFSRLVSIYYLADDHPDREVILAALRASQASGEAVQLTYALPDKTITALVQAGAE